MTDSLEAVAKSLPGLWRAEKVQKKAAKAGFDWPDVTGAMDKLREETDELAAAIKAGSGVEEEFGDLLFSAVNVARFLHVDPEEALAAACEKFIARFRVVEQSILADGKEMEGMPIEDLDKYWDQAKVKLS